jgi:hypothetical protein
MHKRCHRRPIEDLGFSPWINPKFSKQCLQQGHARYNQWRLDLRFSAWKSRLGPWRAPSRMQSTCAATPACQGCCCKLPSTWHTRRTCAALSSSQPVPSPPLPTVEILGPYIVAHIIQHELPITAPWFSQAYRIILYIVGFLSALNI